MFAMDVKRPGMVYAAVKRTPVAGGTLRRVDDGAARAMKGVIDVVKVGPSSAAGLVGTYSAGDTIAVVADSYWRAEKALAALKLEWNTEGKERVSSESIFEQFDDSKIHIPLFGEFSRFSRGLYQNPLRIELCPGSLSKFFEKW